MKAKVKRNLVEPIWVWIVERQWTQSLLFVSELKKLMRRISLFTSILLISNQPAFDTV